MAELPIYNEHDFLPELEQYRAAINENFPNVPITTLDYLSEGWESVACLVNGHLVFLFPKRDMAEHYLRTEIRLLPELAAHLPLPIPRFDYKVTQKVKTAKPGELRCKLLSHFPK